MTQEEFDRRFDRRFKLGYSILCAGILTGLIGGVALGITGAVWPFIVGIAPVIVGGIICNATFAHDIFCNPRWKR